MSTMLTLLNIAREPHIKEAVNKKLLNFNTLVEKYKTNKRLDAKLPESVNLKTEIYQQVAQAVVSKYGYREKFTYDSASETLKFKQKKNKVEISGGTTGLFQYKVVSTGAHWVITGKSKHIVLELLEHSQRRRTKPCASS